MKGFRYGLPPEVSAFNTWLGRLPHKHKIVIGGNHELSLDPGTWQEAARYMDQVGQSQKQEEI